MILVAAAVIIKNDKVLLARRKKGQRLESFWEFPGGKVEYGETLQQCLERELYEELGIIAEAGKIIAESTYNYKDETVNLFAILTNIKEGNFKLTVHDKIKWVKADDLTKYNLAPADVPIAQKIMENIESIKNTIKKE
ncbi:(deoxy)nucleoside triphosphate pyrophosphohydrolase [Deferribacterales bacterium Es71-Z0220]|jgi:8-oxo-dGTP diphosphatase|uniref:(deoxy)nucleoside triphosphate pyrophosphohydrolase n=1 Tax=Deferrivibrio essentukiensis TaxID=2880922 RepID=UPI001F606D4F|nr:(deoxy)nucleoside triphosphate pyrophosphohydrolase [Deferrivibrio essentukiensis]MCB4204268.1 (deoxy)nucleoside triphosphate pyrophosphohydrolase [Deferrivibrio essentukiensis]MDK2791730.1 8-oxo-dGTP diphosphatase [Deferribacteres bacterium]